MKRAIVFALAIAFVLPANSLATEPFAQIHLNFASATSRYMRSARDAGSGGTGICDPGSPTSVTYNPANAVGAAGVSIFYQHDELGILRDGIPINDFGIRYSRGMNDSRWSWGVALRHQRWAYSQTIDRVVFLPEGTGHTLSFDSRYTVASVAGALKHGPFTFALGVAGRYGAVEFVAEDRTGWVYNVGTRAEWLWQGAEGAEVAVRCGVAVVDLDNGIDGAGYRVNYDNMWRFGGGVEVRGGGAVDHPISQRPVRAVTIAVNAESADQDDLPPDAKLGIGMELGLAEMLYLRGGSVQNMPGFSDGATWGLGLATDIGPIRFRADVARYPLNSVFEESQNTVFGFALDYLP